MHGRRRRRRTPTYPSECSTRLSACRIHMSECQTHPGECQIHLSKYCIHLSECWIHLKECSTRLSEFQIHWHCFLAQDARTQAAETRADAKQLRRETPRESIFTCKTWIKMMYLHCITIYQSVMFVCLRLRVCICIYRCIWISKYTFVYWYVYVYMAQDVRTQAAEVCAEAEELHLETPRGSIFTWKTWNWMLNMHVHNVLFRYSPAKTIV